jgi:hypothetical protein
MQRAIVQSMAILILTAAVFGTANRATQPPSQERRPATPPRISDIAPADPGRSDRPRIVTINGANFLEGLTLEITTPSSSKQRFEGADIRDRKETSFQVSVLLSASGTYNFVVTNVDGQSSEPFPLSVQAAPPTAPSVSRVSPSSVHRDQRAQPLRVDGARFEKGLTVTVTAPDGETTTLTGDAIKDLTTTSFSVSLVLSIEGQYSLAVTNPSGGTSNAVMVTVTSAGIPTNGGPGL